MIDWTLDVFFPRDIVYLRGMHAVQGSAATGIAPDPHTHPLPELEPVGSQ
jgi:hypothetical protein